MFKNIGQRKYVAAGGANEVITTKPAVLHKIIFGADVSSSVVEVSDSPTDGDGSIQLKFTGSALMTALGGEVEVNAVFTKGITADIVNQTDITFVFSPTGT